MFVVRQISKELHQPNSSGFISRNEKYAIAREGQAAVFNSIPKKWRINQVLLNNFTKLELELFNFITHAKDILYRLHQSLDRQIDHQYLSYLNNIEAAKHHSTQIFHDTLADAASQLDEEKFEEEWDEILTESLDELETYADKVANKIDLMERAIFDNFKTSQFNDHRSVTLRAKKMVDYILHQEFMAPVKTATEETRDWFFDEIIETKEIIEQSMTVLNILKNDVSKAVDMPQLSETIATFNKQLQNADKNKLRMLNQLRERTNALADKFSLNAITRRSSVFRKCIR
ncbi:MAG: hypothetical protein DRI83_11025 [Bacteroidetes bacterium]|nr:MAG: hypothetical protein DRI83_11025 [Bacteroidota bacterium]